MGSVESYEKIRNENIGYVENGRIERAEAFRPGFDAGARGYVLQIAASDSLDGYDDLISGFREVEPDQYYYPESDIHVTVFEFVSVRSDFRNYEKDIGAFEEVCTEALREVGPFEIALLGTVFTRTSGILAGYDDDILTEIRDGIRNRSRARGIAPLERYRSESAHISFMGYRAELRDRRGFLKLAKATRDLDLGTMTVRRLELVEHDWLNRIGERTLLREYELGK